MTGFSLRSFTSVLIIAFLVWSERCNAMKGRHWIQTTTSSTSPYNKKGSNMPTNSQSKGYSTTTFNVRDYGAQGDGKRDDTKAFEAAWAAACKVEASTIFIPSEYVFLVGPISFSGPYCHHNIIFQLDGTIIAPADAKAWGSGFLQWLDFTKLVGITIKGSGKIDGNGAVWWHDTLFDDPIDDESKLIIIPSNNTMQTNLPTPLNSSIGERMPRIKPTAVRFYGSFNVTVTGITIQNSPQ